MNIWTNSEQLYHLLIDQPNHYKLDKRKLLFFPSYQKNQQSIHHNCDLVSACQQDWQSIVDVVSCDKRCLAWRGEERRHRLSTAALAPPLMWASVPIQTASDRLQNFVRQVCLIFVFSFSLHAGINELINSEWENVPVYCSMRRFVSSCGEAVAFCDREA